MFKILDEMFQNLNVIEVTQGECVGVKFIFGEVQFDEKEEGLVHYEYTLSRDSKPIPDTDAFREVSSQILLQLISEALERQDMIYKGGTKEANAKPAD